MITHPFAISMTDGYILRQEQVSKLFSLLSHHTQYKNV